MLLGTHPVSGACDGPYPLALPLRDWSLITGRGGGGLQNGRGRGAHEVLPLRKRGAEKVLATLKGGAQKVSGSTVGGHEKFPLFKRGGGARKVLPCLEWGGGGCDFPIL